MPPDAPAPETTTQAPAEAAAPSTPAPSDSAPAASTTPPKRTELASLADALTSAGAKKPPAASTREAPSTDTTDSKQPGNSAPASDVKLAASTAEDAQPKPETDDSTAEGDESDAVKGADPKPSRRERATIRDLTAERDTIRGERDTLKTEVESLRAALTIPDEVKQAAIDSRLPDDMFEQLRSRRERENLTGDYLSAEENQKLDQAIQVRDWSNPWYVHAQQKAYGEANAWAQGVDQSIKLNQAKAISQTIKAREWLKPEAIERAGTWDHITEYLADASFEAGGKAKADELQPKLDEALAKIADLEGSVLSATHADVGRGRALERGGESGSGASFKAQPDYKSSSSSDIFTAAIRQAEQQKARRRMSRAS